MPKAEGTSNARHFLGRARHSCARHRFGGQGTARPTCAACTACVVEAVVSTACTSWIGERTGSGAGDHVLAITNFRAVN